MLTPVDDGFLLHVRNVINQIGIFVSCIVHSAERESYVTIKYGKVKIRTSDNTNISGKHTWQRNN